MKPITPLYIEELKWDSAMLGMKSARVRGQFRKEDLSRIIAECRRHRIKYLLCRIELVEWENLNFLLKHDFEILDVLATWRHTASVRRTKRPRGIAIRHFNLKDVSKLASIAEQSFVLDRFHADAAIPRTVSNRAHAQWIINACKGRSAAVLVAEAEGVLCGFISLNISLQQRTRIGSIDLIAVSPRFRKRKIGRFLVEAALAYFKGRVDHVNVGTQLRNYPAWNIYQKSGFALTQASVTLRRLFNL